MSENKQILCVSSRKAFEFITGSLPEDMDFRVEWCKALPKTLSGRYELLLIEIKPATRSLSIVKEVASLGSSAKVLAFSFEGSVRTAVEVMRSGASNFFSLPDEIDLLKQQIILFFQEEQKMRKRDDFLESQKSRYDFSHIIGKCSKLIEVLQIAEKVIKTRVSPVLITGETGTGKGLLARAIHYNSTLRNEPFVEVNCSAIPENLIESELFGYDKGAFTGATSNKKGLFEMADRGTIFLDEIGYLNPTLQVKMLNAIEFKTIRHLGGTETISIDTRIIAATSVDLKKAIIEKKFRKDMYYRLNTVSLTLPPLRDRGDDILILAEYFLNQFNNEYKLGRKKLSPGAKKALMKHSWPGNIRELKNKLERAVILSDRNLIGTGMLRFDEPEPVAADESGHLSQLVIPIHENGVSKEEVERLLVNEILRLSKGNKSKAARMLGVTRPTLINMMKRHGIS
jgi:DNA-binding NtrC family response regulator